MRSQEALVAGVGPFQAKLNTTTMKNDNVADSLFGGDDRDWLFAELSAGSDEEDPHVQSALGEVVVDLV